MLNHFTASFNKTQLQPPEFLKVSPLQVTVNMIGFLLGVRTVNLVNFAEL